MMKKIGSIVGTACLIGAVIMLINGCGKKDDVAGSGKKDEKLKIGFIVKQPEEPWFQLEWKFAEKCAEKNNFELIKLAALDSEKALQAIDNLAASKAKGFVICTPDVRLGTAIKSRAKKLGMKFMTVDDQFLKADGSYMTEVHHLGISAKKIGQTVGKELYNEMQKRGWKTDKTGVCVITYEELDTAKDRTDGAMEGLTDAGFPKDKIYTAPEKTTDVNGAFDAANILLTQHPEVKQWLICGMNDSAVMGAVRAMEGRGFNADNVIGIGINGTDCISELEKKKPTGFFASILLTPKKHGYDTTEMIYKWVAEGVEPPKDTRTTGILIHRGNFVKILKEQGIRD